MQWIDGQRFFIGDTRFLSAGEHDWNAPGFLTVFDQVESTPERFVVWKSRSVIDRYIEQIHELEARNICELGILKGGSTAFFAAVAEPAKLVAVDIAEERVAALDTFIRTHGFSDTVKTYYGVDQKDRVELGKILAAEFGEKPLDLVIDDASHRLVETRSSFNVLFPRLRPDGVYMIEDWSWAHAFHAIDMSHMGPPLTNLIIEILVACATWRDVIAAVEVDWGVARVTRGPAPIDGPFDVAAPRSAATGLDSERARQTFQDR